MKPCGEGVCNGAGQGVGGGARRRDDAASGAGGTVEGEPFALSGHKRGSATETGKGNPLEGQNVRPELPRTKCPQGFQSRVAQACYDHSRPIGSNRRVGARGTGRGWIPLLGTSTRGGTPGNWGSLALRYARKVIKENGRGGKGPYKKAPFGIHFLRQSST